MSSQFVAGATFRTSVIVDRALVEQFVSLSGDVNPIHVDEQVARQYGHAKPVAHGAILVAVISRLIGTQVPGPGAIWMDQQVTWLAPVHVGDEVSLEATVEHMSHGTGVMTLVMSASNQRGVRVLQGQAHVKVGVAVAEQKPGETTRVALVTGGSRGIGASIAERLGRDGWTVAVAYRGNTAAADAAVARIVAAGGTARAFLADVSDAGQVERLVGAVQDAHGSVDVLVHAATPGITPVAAGQLQISDMAPYWDVFLGGAIALVRHTAPGMSQKQFGRMIFLGTSALTGPPPAGWSPYLSAKHALWGYVRSLAQELGPQGITANMVSPGLTVTDLTGDVPVRAKEVEARRNPMRRLATPDDAAALIAFLAGREAGFINGANLPVTGGLL